MDSATIRRKFLDFFEKKGHKIVPSAPLVLKNDPTLLFTNSGMVQFKDYFLGNSTPASKRIADTQKCLRVSGKHNDLEDVGLDTYHHTMFEMLGNWSFGDYFKKEAIAWAWELLTQEYQLPKDRLYVTVFGGDTGDKLPVDEEAKELWKQFVPEDRILHGVKKDNFWEMGEQGPCGPCSEIHIDLRPANEVQKTPGRDLVNRDHPQVVEIWNLVFIQFNRLASGALEPLPDKHVDTGMGFERLCMAIQGKTSNYDTDVFRPLMDFIAREAGVTYSGSTPGKGSTHEKQDIAIRVMADHIRAVAFTIADGQLPSNTGAGYVIRRILRRAVRYGFSYLHFKEPFLHKLVPVLASQLKEVFPELHQQREYVGKVIYEEEVSFLRTLENGLKLFYDVLHKSKLFGEIIASTEVGKGEVPVYRIDGFTAFKLYDTFGFPIDLTVLLARENGATVNIDDPLIGFNALLNEQRTRSRTEATRETGDWMYFDLYGSQTEFEGYNNLEIGWKNGDQNIGVVKSRIIKQKGKEISQVVLSKTPFYPESGGQVGDIGVLESLNGERIRVFDTKMENDLIIHFLEVKPSMDFLTSPIHATVDKNRRKLIMNNHSATHLLHAALRQVLGKHVEQKGSLVNDKVLRFDFSHFAAMTDEELEKVETMVNQKIRENIALQEQRNVPLEKAKAMGAMALFGEKYGEFVRVITFDPKFSVELCGGTHVPFTGNIGLLKIVSESSVAAGVRRIEAVTADGAQHYLNDHLKVLNEIKVVLKNPKDVVASARSLMEEKHALEKKLEVLYQQQAQVLKEELARKASKTNGHTLITEKISVPNADTLKNIAYALRNQFDDLLLVLAANVDGKPQVAVMLGEKVEASKKYHAGNLVKELAKEIDGGGGGQPFFATAGGKNLDGLDRVLVKSRSLIQ